MSAIGRKGWSDQGAECRVSPSAAQGSDGSLSRAAQAENRADQRGVQATPTPATTGQPFLAVALNVLGRKGCGVEGHAAIPSMDSDQEANVAGTTVRLPLSRPTAGVESGQPFLASALKKIPHRRCSFHLTSKFSGRIFTNTVNRTAHSTVSSLLTAGKPLAKELTAKP